MKKDIVGYEELYQIDDNGIIYEKQTNSIVELEKFDTKGKEYKYPVILLIKDGKGLRFLLHHLVADHFIPNPQRKPVVHHYDQNPKNNCVANLRRCNRAEHQSYHNLNEFGDAYFATLED